MKILIKARDGLRHVVVYGVLLPLYKFSLNIQFVKAKNAMDVARLARSVCLQTILLKHKELPLNFDDLRVMALVEAVYRFVDPDLPPGKDPKVSPADIEAFEAELVSNDDAKRLKVICHLARAHFSGLAKQPEKQEKELAAAKAIDPNAELVAYSALMGTRKQLKVRLKTLHKRQRESRALKFEIDAGSLTWVLPTISSLFLINGFLHTRLLLGHFGIDAAVYFSLTDYLAASIQEISSAAIGVAIGTASFLWGARSVSVMWEHEKRADDRHSRYPIIFIGVVSAVGLVLSLYRGQLDQALFAASVLALFATFWVSAKLARWFTKPLVMFGVFVAVISFVVRVLISAFASGYAIENADPEAMNKDGYVFTQDIDIDPSKSVTIMANSEYLFLYDTVTKTPIVVAKRFLVTAQPRADDISRVQP